MSELDFNNIKLNYKIYPSKDIILNNKVIDLIEKIEEKLVNISHKFTSLRYEEDKDELYINISYSFSSIAKDLSDFKNDLKK